eukprot:3892458-Rhodomonas_salina.1
MAARASRMWVAGFQNAEGVAAGHSNKDADAQQAVHACDRRDRHTRAEISDCSSFSTASSVRFGFGNRSSQQRTRLRITHVPSLTRTWAGAQGQYLGRIAAAAGVKPSRRPFLS